MEQEKFEAKNNYNFKIYGDIIWRSSDTDVAKVNKKGNVTVKSEGNAAITASIRYKGTNIYGTKVDNEVVVYRHWIHSGPVLQLKKGNVKAVAGNAQGIRERDRRIVIRAKGSPEETKELFKNSTNMDMMLHVIPHERSGISHTGITPPNDYKTGVALY